MTLNLPLIISDSGDITVFNSVETAESYFDPYDIHSLTGFDSQGKALVFNTRKEGRKVLGIYTEVEKVDISIKGEEIREHDLRKIITEYLSRLQYVNHQRFLNEHWDQLPLPALIEIVRGISSQSK